MPQFGSRFPSGSSSVSSKDSLTNGLVTAAPKIHEDASERLGDNTSSRSLFSHPFHALGAGCAPYG